MTALVARPKAPSPAATPAPAPQDTPASPALSIYYMHPVVAGPLAGWGEHFSRCKALGFSHVLVAPPFAPGRRGDITLTGDHERLHPALADDRPADAALAALAAQARAAGLGLMLDLVLDRVAVDGTLAAARPSWFTSFDRAADPLPDPRRPVERRDVARARFDEPVAAGELVGWWAQRLGALAAAGIAGFRCLDPQRVPVAAWTALIKAVKAQAPATRFLAWTSGLAPESIERLAPCGFDAAGFTAQRASDVNLLVAEQALTRSLGPTIVAPEEPLGTRLATQLGSGSLYTTCTSMLRLGAATGDGLLVPMGFEYAARRPLDPIHASPDDLAIARLEAPFDLSAEIEAANGLQRRLSGFEADGEVRVLTGPGAPFTAILRSDAGDTRVARHAVMILLNNNPRRALDADLGRVLPGIGADFAPFRPLGPEPQGHGARPSADGFVALEPGELKLLEARRAAPVGLPAAMLPRVEAAAEAPRLVIDRVDPAVDGGRFAAKRTVGETVPVAATIFADGHDELAAEIRYKAADEEEWQRVPMRLSANDRWHGAIKLRRLGRYMFKICAWWDAYGTFTHGLHKKVDAKVDVTLELEEGRVMLAAALKRAQGEVREVLDAIIRRLAESADEERALVLLEPATVAAMAVADERPFLVETERPLLIDAERTAAGFASWYELFPRSITDDPNRHGTLRDVIGRLPAVQAMGFDVLYFPPIHPIGRKNRKGRNNTLTPGPDDVGSPYAIGSPEGGHGAIHPALGTIEDFRALRAAAEAHGLELALDFAINCSVDHPWISEHPGWYAWRPDGSLRYAENPPKRYEDITNVDFYAEDAVPDLWLALRDVVQLWVDEGVRTFRVDNPHTKPLPFWEWLIADIRSRDPGVLFLAEAFTRPAMMGRLGKVGFSQSYTYFTWRNSKRELTDYLVELTTSELKDSYRPHFFVNTPDINPYFLQTSGRAGFLVRAALATTLSGLWGMYSGFEICEAAPLPGREEYLDSEKYEIRVRDWNQPGNIIAEVTQLNRIRKANPALRTHLGVRFYSAFNDNVIYYGKQEVPGEDMILVAVNLDPHHAQDATIEVPLWEWGLSDTAGVEVEDLMRGHRFSWYGKSQQIRLDPRELPFSIWRIAPPKPA